MDRRANRPAGALQPQLVSAGLVTAPEAMALQEVFEYNPLLCDLVLKLTVRHPHTGARFPVPAERRRSLASTRCCRPAADPSAQCGAKVRGGGF